MLSKFKKVIFQVMGKFIGLMIDILEILVIGVVLFCVIYSFDKVIGEKYPWVGWLFLGMWLLFVRTVFYRGMISFQLKNDN